MMYTVTMFQAGAADRDQRLEEFCVFGYLFEGNGGLHCEYIHLNVPGDNHPEVRGKQIHSTYNIVSYWVTVRAISTESW